MPCNACAVRDCSFGMFQQTESIHMKPIALLVCGMLLLLSNTAEARPFQWLRNRTSTQPARVTYTQPVRVAGAASTTRPAQPAQATPAADTMPPVESAQATPAPESAQATPAAEPVAATPVAASTAPAPAVK